MIASGLASWVNVGNSVGAIANSLRGKTGSYHPNYAGYLCAYWQPTVIIIFAKKPGNFCVKLNVTQFAVNCSKGKALVTRFGNVIFGKCSGTCRCYDRVYSDLTKIYPP